MNALKAGKRQVLLPISAWFVALMAILLLFFLLPSQPGQAGQGGTIIRAGIKSPSANTITIGVAADLSQFVQDIGFRQVNSVVMLASLLNSTGGIAIAGVPHDILVAVVDSQCTDGSVSQAAANWLVSQGVVAVVGHTCSNSSLAAQPIYAAANIAMVSASSTLPGLTDSGFTNVFRVITRDDSPPARLGIYLYKHLGYRKIAIVEMQSSDPSLTNFLSNSFTSLGGTISNRYTLASTADYAATIALISTEGVDAIFYNGPDPVEAGQFSQAVDGGGLTGTPVAWLPNNSEMDLLGTYLGTAGSAAEDDLAMLHYRDKELMPDYAIYNTNYLAQNFPNYGDEGQEWGAFAYDAAQLIINAILAADSAVPGVILSELHNPATYAGVVGTYYGFDVKGDVIPQWMWFGSVRDAAWNELKAVTLVTDSGGINDSGFNQSVYQGVQKAVSEDKIIATFFESTGDGDYLPFLNQCAEDSNHLCIAVGFSMADAVKNAALTHPEVKYAIMDAEISNPPENLRYYDFAEDEAGYLAGTLAGLMSSSNVVGAVGGMSIVPAVVDFVERYGHAAVCANPSATAILTYTETFVDPVLGAQTAADQMALGADVIFGAAGPTGNGAILYAAQNGAYAIGVDTDQYLTVFANGTVDGSDMLLSSALKRLDNASYDAIIDLLDGNFSSGRIAFRLENEGVGLAPFHEMDAQIPGYVKLWLSLIEEKIIAGDLDIYADCLTPQFVYLPVIVK